MAWLAASAAWVTRSLARSLNLFGSLMSASVSGF